ncbi:MAG: FAD-binding protein, partial [Clostridia bacterium]|nr:FAD-binding protein [Clostridia bacterium]
MKTWNINGRDLPVKELDTAVIGSGCAGLNAADWLWDFGRRDIALITEGMNSGTSRNTGSDKQTYYKLSLASDGADSVAAMAADLFAGEGVDGDTALAEAAGSVRAFIKLCNLGVPFPTNEYGEDVGYKTDHDPRQRATSAGPLTSRYMTEALERAVRQKGVPILDNMSAVRLLVADGRVAGVLCLDHEALDTPTHGLTVVLARQVVLATGGPAGCYAQSVYPESQTGMTGMALEAGVLAANLDQWQYGLASLGFRWNVSGTYQQVLPRYISVDAEGVEREFLPDYFDSPAEALDRVFLKGYQWPFDSEKLHGSSVIDLIVHHETVDLGRRVYMDYRTDPKGLEQGFGVLSEETRRYLENSGALLPTPIARLQKMNPPAIELYRTHGIDLTKEPLEIGVCAQHHNGGLLVDTNWQTTLPGLYAV